MCEIDKHAEFAVPAGGDNIFMFKLLVTMKGTFQGASMPND